MNIRIVCTVLLLATPLVAASQGIKRTPVTRADLSAPGTEAVVMRVELERGASAGRHTHPGDEISYVTEGEGELLIDGEAPRKLKAGEAFVVPAGKVHDARNAGAAPMRLVWRVRGREGQAAGIAREVSVALK